jgi:signal peptidase I
MTISPSVADELKTLNFVDTVFAMARSGVEPNIYPDANRFPWSGDSFGPLIIPKEGMTIAINDSTLTTYGKMIVRYDHNKDVKIEGVKLFIEGKEVTEYTFKQNYYFMMGDNRHNSLDSRYWGFVPEDHIVGKAFFIWLSIDRDGSFLNKIRWNRFFKLIK